MKKHCTYLLLPLVFLAFACRSGSETAEDIAITKLYESDDSHSIIYDTSSDESNTLINDPDAIFIILEQTPDNEWLIAERSPASPGPGRIETEHLLFYIPGRRQIDIEALHPSLSSYGISFAETDGALTLIAPLKGKDATVSLPLQPLLEDSIPDIPVMEEHESITQTGSFDPDAEPQFGITKTDKQAVVLELMLQADDARVGEALIPRLTDDGHKVNSIISYTARNGKIYIVESIQYRVLVYDYEGNFLHAVSYPESLPDRDIRVNVRGIAVDDDYIYLLSQDDNSIYVIDSETEDMVTLISEGGSQSGRFIDIAHLTIDHEGYLRIHDRRSDSKGEVYTYSREGQMLRWITTEQYSHSGQMVPAPDGNSYEASVIDDSYKVTSHEGDYLIRNRTPMGLASAEVVATDTDGNVYVMCEEFGGQIAGPFNLKVISPQGKELFSLTTSFWDGGGPVVRRVVITPTGEVFDAYYDGNAFHDFVEEELVVTKLIVERLK